jgi:hypothetical protein
MRRSRAYIVGSIVVLASASVIACTFVATFGDRVSTDADAGSVGVDSGQLDATIDVVRIDSPISMMTTDGAKSDAPSAIDASDDTNEPSDSGCNDDMQTSPTNCGTCGHDCLGSTCTAGKCDPHIITANRDRPTALAISNGNVFFVEGGTQTLNQVVVTGGIPTDLAHATSYPYGVTAGADGLYWATTNDLYFTPPDGGATTKASHDSLCGGYGVAFNSTNVFVTDTCGKGTVWKGSRDPNDAGLVQLETVIGSSFVYPANILLVGVNVFYSAGGGDGGGLIETASVNGGLSTSLATAEPQLQAIATDSTSIFWVDRGYAPGTGQLKMLPLSGGGNAVTLASDLLTPQSVAVDDQYVYITQSGQAPAYADGSITRFNKTTPGPGYVMAANQTFPNAVALDGTAVYWTSYGTQTASGTTPSTGAILRVAK